MFLVGRMVMFFGRRKVRRLILLLGHFLLGFQEDWFYDLYLFRNKFNTYVYLGSIPYLTLGSCSRVTPSFPERIKP
jgi:hypothetical protein